MLAESSTQNQDSVHIHLKVASAPFDPLRLAGCETRMDAILFSRKKRTHHTGAGFDDEKYYYQVHISCSSCTISAFRITDTVRPPDPPITLYTQLRTSTNTVSLYAPMFAALWLKCTTSNSRQPPKSFFLPMTNHAIHCAHTLPIHASPSTSYTPQF